MRNFVFNRLSHFDPVISGDMLFQNFVLLLLREQNLVSEVNYWRTKDKAEVDFIARIGAQQIPVEVKFSRLRKDNVGRSVVNLELETERIVEGVKVRFIPFYKLLDSGLLSRSLV